MSEKAARLVGMFVLASGCIIGGAAAVAQPVDTALIDSGSPNDWLTYHGILQILSLQPARPDQHRQCA